MLIRSRFRFVAQSRLVTKLIYKYLDKKGPGLAAGIAARTRYIDDLVKQQLAAGINQVVILGAGLDMRAYRMEELQNAKVIEVDFPATQQLKRSKLRELSITEPEGLEYVSIDFNKQPLDETLIAAGFNSSRPTFFIWEGVTMYLDARSVDATLKAIHNLSAPNSSLYFDYLYQSVLDGRNTLPEAIAVRESQSFAGRGSEKYTYGIEESEMKEYLAERGFELAEHLSGDDLKKRYFHGENADRYVFGICGFVLASVS